MAVPSVWNFINFGYSCQLNSHYLYHTLDLVSQCVQSVMCQQDTSLSWNFMNLCWIPHLLILAAQTRMYQLKCSGQIQIRTEYKLGFIRKVSSELWSSASPSCSLTWVFLHFSYISSLDLFEQSSLESFKTNHSKKKNSCLAWAKQLRGSPVTHTLHQRNWNWGDISWDICQWGYLAELEDVESPGYQIQRWHYIDKRMERKGPGSSPP